MNELERLLIQRVLDSGPITFADYMRAALYHPEHGYYARAPRSGWGGDFLTSPELHSVFGRCWARAFADAWSACGKPSSFGIVELGAGEGGFAEAVLASLPSELAGSITYHIVEPLPRLRDRQELRLSRFPQVTWSASLQQVQPLRAGCFFANEVLDNLAVHLVQQHEGELMEVMVDVQDGVLEERLMPPSSPELGAFLARAGVELREGQRYEVALEEEELVRQASRLFDMGLLILVDYGADAERLLRGGGGSLATSGSRWRDGRGALARPGEQDLTRHVNWTTVGRVCKSAGFQTQTPLKQSLVLERLGLASLLASEFRAGTAGQARQLRQIRALVDPASLGRVGVLVAARGMRVPSRLSHSSS